MLSHAAGAQLPGVVSVAAPTADTLPSFERPNGMLLRTGTLTYALSLAKPGGATTALGVRTVTIAEAQLGGAPGWLVADARTGTVVPTADSVYLSRADLAPERWSATNGSSRVGVSFSRDSIFGAVDSYQGRSSFALAVPSNVLLSAGMLERVLELLPLREGYHVGASLLLIEGASQHLVPAEIIVRPPEPVDVGGTTVDAWLVLLRWGANEERLWIARGATRVVRTEQAVAGGLLTSVLQQP
ncbi:hypothetical protein BH11GEM1_BH11GEM1_23100 [soil metagenome]